MILTYEQFLMESQQNYDRYRIPQYLIDKIDDVDVRKHLMNNDPAAEDNLAILLVTVFGHTEVVKLLLQDPRVDPTAYDNEAIRQASFNGHVKIVKLLLQDARVDPTPRDNRAIRQASKGGQTEMVRLLAQHFCEGPLMLSDEEIKEIVDETEAPYIHSVIELRNHRDDSMDRAGETTQLLTHVTSIRRGNI